MLRFLILEWQKEDYVNVLKEHIVVVGIEDAAYQFTVEAIVIKRELIPELASNQEEADTRLAVHVKHMSDNDLFQNIIVRANDTDVLIILLTHVSDLSAHIWMDAGLHIDELLKKY